jgi:hypothetical protein
MSRREDTEKNLRKYLNPAIKGPKTNDILNALSYPLSNLVHNAEAVNDMIYVVTAEGQYLDQLLGSKGLNRPENVGLSDEIFRQIGIEVTNRKQVRSLINNLLKIVFGDEYVSATIDSNFAQPFALEDGDSLTISFDDLEPVTVFFETSQFANINQATAQEVADVITKEIRRLGKRGSAIALDDGTDVFVRLISQTAGPSSTVKVVGGKAQNQLRFDRLVPTSGLFNTQWTVEKQPNGNIRMIWTGGPSPSIGLVNINDYVNIYSTSFSEQNRGTFTIVGVKGGLIGEAYIEIENPIGVNEIVLQGFVDGVMFFTPVRKTLNNKLAFAAAYQTENRLLEIFVPATTKVVRRSNIGASYIQDDTPSVDGGYGPYLWDITKGYVIGEENCVSTQVIDSSVESIVFVDDSSKIPDDQGYLIFGFGTAKEEGPVPYLARPSANSLIINPTYNFKFVHEIGTDISLVQQNSVYFPAQDGSSFPFYITDEVSGRIYAEELVELVKATGIRLIVNVMYPLDTGFGKYGTEFSEITKIYGPDPK